MSAAVPDDMIAIVIPMLYAVTTHCRPASPTSKSDWMAGRATFTINASRKIMKRPRLVAARVKRCVLVIGRSKVSVTVSCDLWPVRCSCWFSQHKVGNDQRTEKSQNGRADDIGQIMRTYVHPREADQNRDWEARKSDAPTCDK